MGGIGKMHFSHYKALLKLSDEALELADRHNLDEKKLRYVLALSQEYHAEIVRQIIDFSLSSKQVQELCESDGVATGSGDDPPDKIPAAALKLAQWLNLRIPYRLKTLRVHSSARR
jgi:hypothetical protein